MPGFTGNNAPPSLIDQNDSWDLQAAYLQKKVEELQQKSATGDTLSRQNLPFFEQGLKNAQGWDAQRGFNNWQPGSTGRPQSSMTPGLANMMMNYLGSTPNDPQVQRMKAWAAMQPSFSLHAGGHAGGLSMDGSEYDNTRPLPPTGADIEAQKMYRANQMRFMDPNRPSGGQSGWGYMQAPQPAYLGQPTQAQSANGVTDALGAGGYSRGYQRGGIFA